MLALLIPISRMVIVRRMNATAEQRTARSSRVRTSSQVGATVNSWVPSVRNITGTKKAIPITFCRFTMVRAEYFSDIPLISSPYPTADITANPRAANPNGEASIRKSRVTTMIVTPRKDNRRPATLVRDKRSPRKMAANTGVTTGMVAMVTEARVALTCLTP